MKPTATPNAKSRTAKRAKAAGANMGFHTSATAAATLDQVIPVPAALTRLKDAYLAEPLQRESTTAQPLAEALTDFFAQLLPDTERKSLFTLTKFCLMELTLIKLARVGKEE